jgi:hypothetical protein
MNMLDKRPPVGQRLAVRALEIMAPARDPALINGDPRNTALTDPVAVRRELNRAAAVAGFTDQIKQLYTWQDRFRLDLAADGA